MVGCYAFLVDGKYNGSSWCFLHHNPYSIVVDRTSSSTSAIPNTSTCLINLIKNLVEDIKTSARVSGSSENIILKDTINDLKLFVAGGN